MRTRLLAALLPGPQPHRGSPLEDKAPPKEDLCPHQGGSDRGDGSSTGSREYRRRTRFLRSLRLLHPGAAAMKDAVRTALSCSVGTIYAGCCVRTSENTPSTSFGE